MPKEQFDARSAAERSRIKRLSARLFPLALLILLLASLIVPFGLSMSSAQAFGEPYLPLVSVDSNSGRPAATVKRGHKPTQTPTPTATPVSTATSAPATPTLTATAASTATQATTRVPTNTPAPATPTATTVPSATPATDVQPALPLRAAFYYPWFPEAWTQLGIYPYTNYSPGLGYYNGSDAAVIAKHVSAMQYGGIGAGILSWWGQGSATDNRVSNILAATAGSSFRWSIYYEPESLGDPSVATLAADLAYLRDRYGSNPAYLRINGRPVVFVYTDGADGCAMADRWKQANAGINAYLVLKVFAGYTSCASQPDGWHQYGPAVAADRQGSYSYTISPGFDKVNESPRLVRDLTRWRQNVRDMIASGARFQLITTFNEWGEGTSVESATQWASASGYGSYLDALHNNGAEPSSTPIAATATPTRTPVPATATSTSTPTRIPTNIPVASPTAGPTSTPVPATATRTATSTPAATFTATPAATPAGCTDVVLTKGPTLILTGSNTEMKVFWQWSANTTFTVHWGTDTGYRQGSGTVTAHDSTNHLYAYTIQGLTPGVKYYYQVAAGSQCSSASFFAPPAASATTVKFFAYGDTRTNGSVHNGLAGQIVSLFNADPAFQTLNLNVGDWVSGDSESAWAGEWYGTSYTNLRRQEASIADTGVRGNHEGSAVYFKRYFPQPYQPGGLYRSFDYGPMHIAMIDQYTAYNAGSTQYNWLKNDLAASTKTWKAVVLHEPGWSAGGGHGNNTTVQNDLEPLFKQYGVAIVFGGHNHYYARATVDGIQHLTVGGGGAPLYAPASGYPNIVITSQSYGFGEFAISGNTLTAKIVNSSGAAIDSFTITR